MATALGGLGAIVNGLIGGTGQGTNVMAGYYPATTVWQNWNQQFYVGTTTQATTQTVWMSWNTVYQTAQPVPAEVIQTMQEHARLLEESRAKAKELLIEHLTPAQKDSYEKHGMFIVEGSKKNHYRLSRTGAPRKIAGDKDAVSYCIHTSGLPREDELLGFKLLLEANEDEFLRTANATQLAA